MSELWTLPQVAAALDVEYRTLHSWVQRGLIQPTYPSAGTGSRAHLTYEDIRLVRLLAMCRNAGCGFEILERVAAEPEGGSLELAEGVTLTWSWGASHA